MYSNAEHFVSRHGPGTAWNEEGTHSKTRSTVCARSGTCRKSGIKPVQHRATEHQAWPDDSLKRHNLSISVSGGDRSCMHARSMLRSKALPSPLVTHLAWPLLAYLSCSTANDMGIIFFLFLLLN